MTDLFLLYIWILTVMIISLEIIATAPFKKAAEWSDKYPHILMTKPLLRGFYYTPKPDLIQCYA